MNAVIRERCGNCRGNILTHNPVAICNQCNKIVHANCSTLFEYDQVIDTWFCETCKLSRIHRYNPFEYFSDNRYNQDIAEHFEDINIISNILNNCSIYTTQSASNACSSKFSVLFNNIDGNMTNFDNFAVEVSGLNVPVIGIAETNILS